MDVFPPHIKKITKRKDLIFVIIIQHILGCYRVNNPPLDNLLSKEIKGLSFSPHWNKQGEKFYLFSMFLNAN